jgi:large subunit ribosomal protein L10
LAITKEKKRQIVDLYGDWLTRSEALVLTEYTGLSVKDLDELRAKIRDAGGEFHIVKNTLAKLAFEAAELPVDESNFVGSTAIGFAFEDPPALAKAMTEFAKGTDFLKVKSGYLDKQLMTAKEVKALAAMPPLPVMRAMLLGTLMAPASQLVRVLSEPGRQVAVVLKAYSEQETAAEAA